MSSKRRLRFFLGAVLLVPSLAWANPYPRFQDLVDRTPSGGELRPEPGVYAGPVTVRREMRIDGAGGVEIRGGGAGTVVSIRASGVVLRGLKITGSGHRHDKVDAAIHVRGHDNVIEGNVIEDCLFGIDLAQSDRNVVRSNRVRSKSADMGMRGDAIRVWYGRGNEILDNEIEDSRDMVVWYSGQNTIAGNRVRRGRYALHFMYSEENRVERNDFADSTVGVFLMYSEGVIVRDNRIVHCADASGMGVGLKESSGVRIERNAVIGCATGIYLDVSPYQPDMENRILSNDVAYNGVGIVLHSDWPGNVIRGNRFVGNFSQVAVRGGGGATRNDWSGNHWDEYQGFDRDANDVGDTPHEVRAYSDRLWMHTPAAEFFRGAPVLEAIDFLQRLAPFSEPILVLRDEAPRFDRAEESAR